MDKILEIGDFFQPTGNTFNPLPLLPVLLVFCGAVAVFLLGFSKADTPKLEKGSVLNSNANKKSERGSATEFPVASQLSPKHDTKEVIKPKPAKKEVSKVNAVHKTNNNAAVASKDLSKSTLRKVKSVAVKNVVNNKEETASKKPLDNATNDDGGWQTVQTKKQKKSTNDVLIQAVADAAADASAKSVARKSNEQQKAPNKTKKSITEENKQHVAMQPAAIVVDNKDLNDKKTDSVAPYFIEVGSACNFVALQPIINSTAVAIEEAAAYPVSNLAFDELPDSIWTEAKTPKKSKKRALRE